MTKKNTFLGLLFICTIIINSSAAIRRVGFGAIPLAGVDYTNFADAHTAASPGDTIQFYNNITTGYVTKRLVLIGYGHNFDVHPNLNVIGVDYPSGGHFYFMPGSEYSTAIGLKGVAYIQASNITISRSYLGVLGISNGPIQNTLIISCVVQSTSFQTSSQNTSFYNCIIKSFEADNNISSTGKMVNCVAVYYFGLYWNFQSAAWHIKNCMILGAQTVNNCIFDNNLFADAQPVNPPMGMNNLWNQNWTLIFDRLGNYNSGQSTLDPGIPDHLLFDEDFYLLRQGSPAINAGEDMSGNPTDCGIFGGELAYRYKLSGVPDVPSFYKLMSPGNDANSNPYNITISVKSNN